MTPEKLEMASALGDQIGWLGMKRKSILHIGDIHYPELVASGRLGDVKSRSFAGPMLDRIAPSRLNEILKRLVDIATRDCHLVAIVCTGDLTTRGNLDGYVSAINLLRKTLNAISSNRPDEPDLIVVPGNHDIDRAAIRIGSEPAGKFEGINSEWIKAFPDKEVFHYLSPRGRTLKLDTTSEFNSRVCVYPLNTCLLSGEYIGFPEGIRRKIEEELARHRENMGDAMFFEMLTEQVDCPAVDRSHVEALAQQITQSSSNSVNLVLGHHPLLPQATPRVDGYVELLNGGFIRESLFSTGRTVIYLHGHIHQSPIHIVSNREAGECRLIHISAPEFRDGFNIINFYFAEESGAVLGLEVCPYRFRDSQGLCTMEKVSLRLLPRDAVWNELDHPVSEAILAILSSPEVGLRFNTLVERIKAKVKIRRLSDEKYRRVVAEKLNILETLEVVGIVNRSAVWDHWQVRRRSI